MSDIEKDLERIVVKKEIEQAIKEAYTDADIICIIVQKCKEGPEYQDVQYLSTDMPLKDYVCNSLRLWMRVQDKLRGLA
jgi:hypothetical protein